MPSNPTSTAEMSLLGRLPVVIILGATGTGKSKLAVQLAKKFGGEIISADSMQVYKGLDILTNKVTSEEMQGVPHHMISFVKPCERYDVTYFRKQALPIVERILLQGKIPFIVGGTNYYIESLLWEILIDHPETSISDKRKATEEPNVSHEFTTREWDNQILSLFSANAGCVKDEELSNFTNSELHNALREVDEDRAVRLHPNDIRKVRNSLHIFFRTGKKHSDIIAEQRRTSVKGIPETPNEDVSELNLSPPPSSHLGGPLRYRNSLCLWIRTPQEILDRRIDARVDEMILKGLRQELHSYFQDLMVEERDLDFTRGLLQSIGFKEFHTYLQGTPDDRDSEDATKLFAEGVLELKLATKRYARKQLKWINQRFLRPSRRQLPEVYWLDCTTFEATDWDEGVASIGENILKAYLASPASTSDSLLLKERRVIRTETRSDDLLLRNCSFCDRNFIGELQWERHVASKKHRLMQRKATLAEIENGINAPDQSDQIAIKS